MRGVPLAFPWQARRREESKINYLEPQCFIETHNCVASLVVKSNLRVVVANRHTHTLAHQEDRQAQLRIIAATGAGPLQSRVAAVPADGSRSAQRGLTPRSRRGPTAGHQARSGGTRTFSPARAWRPAVGPASARTLGIRRAAVWYASRKCACRRELNSHELQFGVVL